MPRYNQPKKTHRYTTEFKTKAVRLSHMEGVQIQEVAKTLDIHYPPLYTVSGRKEYREGKRVPDKRQRS